MQPQLKTKMTANQDKKINVSNAEPQHSALVKNEVQPNINLEGELKLNDYINDVPASHKTIDELADWTSKQRETTRTNIATWLVKTLGCSIGATFLITGLAAFSPNADKAFIKETIPLVLTPQATILGVAIGYYFGATEEK